MGGSPEWLAGMSSGVTGTIKAALPHFKSRLDKLMPLVVSWPFELAQAITIPPGHIQKL